MPNRPHHGEQAAIVPSLRADVGVQSGRGDGQRFAVDLTFRYAETGVSASAEL